VGHKKHIKIFGHNLKKGYPILFAAFFLHADSENYTNIWRL